MPKKMNTPLMQCAIKFSNTKKGEFEGYASTFGNIDTYRDTVQKGAYKETIKNGHTIPMFINHDSYQIPVGKFINLKEDDTGLNVTGQIDLNHKDGPSLISALKNQNMDGLSIGYSIIKNGSYFDEDKDVTVLTNINLKEISAVNFPADSEARISVVKSEIMTIESLKDAELFLRDAGVFSKSTATAFVSRINEMVRRDAGTNDDEIANLHSRLQTKDAINSLVNFIDKL